VPDIKSIQDDIRARLAEIEGLIEPLGVEVAQLTRLVATFDGSSEQPAAPPAKLAPALAKAPRKKARRASRPTAAPRAKRGRPTGSGNRAQQAVEHITQKPGITASELASAMGIAPNYLYRVLPRLERDAKITKQGKGYHPAGAVAEAPRTNGHVVKA